MLNKKLLLTFLSATATISFLSACSSGGDTHPSPNAEVDPGPPPPPYWQVPTPDFSPDPERPVISINGARSIQLSVGEAYEELGASASDSSDGDLSNNIETDNQVDTSAKGDYFVRYSVTDSDGNSALEAVRLVRVVNEEPPELTPRPLGSTMSHLGYAEYLPPDYGIDPDKKYPLMIYNHGNAANVEFGSDNPLSALGLSCWIMPVLRY